MHSDTVVVQEHASFEEQCCLICALEEHVVIAVLGRDLEAERGGDRGVELVTQPLVSSIAFAIDLGLQRAGKVTGEGFVRVMMQPVQTQVWTAEVRDEDGLYEERVLGHGIEDAGLGSEAADLRKRRGDVLNEDRVRGTAVQVELPARVRR